MLKASEYADRLRSISIDYRVEWGKSTVNFFSVLKCSLGTTQEMIHYILCAGYA